LDGPKGFRNLLAPWIAAGLCQIVKDEIRFWNGAKIRLCHCQYEKDVYNYLSYEFHVLALDEGTSFTENMYRLLRSRVRAPGLVVPEKFKGMFPRILIGTNPGGVGHHFFKDGWVDFMEPYEIKRMSEAEGGMLRQFIPALLDDNPSMLQDDPGYRSRLRGIGPPSLVRAYELGDWNIIIGAFFPEFKREKHVIPRFVVPAHWTRFRSADWGYSKPFSIGWWAVADGNEVLLYNGQRKRFPRGSLIRYKEWYGATGPNKGLKLTDPKIAEGVVSRSRDENFVFSTADPSIFGDGDCTAKTWAEHGFVCHAANNDRKAGWAQLRWRLGQDDDIPTIYFTENCIDTIRTLPALQQDDHDPEDVDSDGEDHAGDETRYACMERIVVTDAPVSNAPKFVQDMTLDDLWDLQDTRVSSRI